LGIAADFFHLRWVEIDQGGTGRDPAAVRLTASDDLVDDGRLPG
jgi:hypothetical protein